MKTPVRKKKELQKERKKPGPVANPNLVMTTVSLESEMLEWGKKQPAGLSALLRRLMREEYQRQGGE